MQDKTYQDSSMRERQPFWSKGRVGGPELDRGSKVYYWPNSIRVCCVSGSERTMTRCVVL